MTTDVTHALAAEVERFLDSRINLFELPENLRESIRYVILGGGKRLRPTLALLSCEAAGGRRTDALAPAAALELIHAFSLVHDDLPAMDDDDMRRGRPTLHIHAGEAMAILAGDAMMSLAFKLVLESGLDMTRRIRVLQELADGTTAMIAGQVYDTLGGFSRGLSPTEKLHLIHRNKTGALIRVACRIGGICAGASDERLEALTRYGESVGLMFQIVDDLLDVTQSADHIGKATGKDQSAGKITFPSVIGVDRSREEVQRLERKAIDAIAILGGDGVELERLCHYLAVRTK